MAMRIHVCDNVHMAVSDFFKLILLRDGEYKNGINVASTKHKTKMPNRNDNHHFCRKVYMYVYTEGQSHTYESNYSR